MATVADAVTEAMRSASWIRKMYEGGLKLRQKFGPDNVFDFSLGNPHLEPPAAVLTRMREVADDSALGKHRYMQVAGFEDVRRDVAVFASKWQQCDIPWNHILMTGGAACGLNVALRTLLNPGDGVVIPIPMFSEYTAYVAQAGGVCQWIDTKPDFDLDLERLADAIDERTKVVLLNTPNNPSGVIYSAPTMASVGQLLRDRSKKFGRDIVLLTDDVYRRVVFEGEVPASFEFYPATIAIASFSKDLGLAGERIGFIAVHPEFPGAADALPALEHSLRTLGFVNANAFMQRLIARCLDIPVELDEYRRNRNAMHDGLAAIGYDIVKPPGSLFMFPKSPIADDVAFAARLAEENILVVPGVGFRRPGYFRLSFAAPEIAIQRSLAGFRKAFEASRK